MHQKLQTAYAGNGDVVFLYAQTVFEGFETNDFDAGLGDLKKLGITAPYAFDPGDPTSRKPSSIMAGYRTRGTPWTIVIDREGIVRYSAFTAEGAPIRAAIDASKTTQHPEASEKTD